MVVYFLTSVTGLQRWSDYIPVKLVQTGSVNSYNNNGFIAVAPIAGLSSQTQAWKEYIPVYVDSNATEAWQVSAVGYIPYGYALFGDASLQLDFINGASLDSRVTFTRTTTATRTNSSGLIESVAINGPRFDYNPTTLAPNGLLIEEQRTNLLLNSLINGTSLSTQIVATTAVSTTLSFYGTGQIVLSGSSSATVVGTGAYPSRRTLTFTPTVGALTLTVTGTVQYAQLEAGAFSTSYIPTGVSQVTRTADVATMTGTNFSNWYNATEGTLYGEFSRSATTNSQQGRVFNITDGSNSNAIEVYQTGGNNPAAQITTGGVGQALWTPSGFTVGALIKEALAFATNSSQASFNGSAETQDTSCTVPVVNQARIGNRQDGLRALNGTISRIAFYPRRLTNSQLQAITS
jgi:hypothetical protein